MTKLLITPQIIGFASYATPEKRDCYMLVAIGKTK